MLLKERVRLPLLFFLFFIFLEPLVHVLMSLFWQASSLMLALKRKEMLRRISFFLAFLVSAGYYVYYKALMSGAFGRH